MSRLVAAFVLLLTGCAFRSAPVAVPEPLRLLRGHGEAEKEGSIYAPAQKRALAVALSRAITAAYAH